MKDIDIEKAKKLRRQLHERPEISNEEKETANIIKKSVMEYGPDEIIENIGGNGLIFIFDSKIPGKNILIRADMDALKVKEISDAPYRSIYEDKGHLCGHDGHSASLVLFSSIVRENLKKGKIILVFQGEEETGKGAEKIVNDDRIKNLNIDYCFSYHNIPGEKEGTVLIPKREFACASTGIIISLQGKTSHAAYPENGINPSAAIGELLIFLNDINRSKYQDFFLSTIVGARLGDKTFGTSCGEGEVMATIRSSSDETLENMSKDIEEKVKNISEKYNLKFNVEYIEPFPATNNDKEALYYVKKAASDLGFKIKELSEPFRWSEDFGYFTKKYKGAMIGIGIGKDKPYLHTPNYDFNDNILEISAKLWGQLVKEIS
ncbi:MAG: amidohydrolase [Bacillota bacterium]|nr:amidohydrolase [Bacillota bacterium]